MVLWLNVSLETQKMFVLKVKTIIFGNVIEFYLEVPVVLVQLRK